MQIDFSSHFMWGSYRAHGDPFPLAPDWVEAGLESQGICFPQRGSWTARALNSLAMHGANSIFDKILHGVLPNTTQVAVRDRIVECLRDSGEPPVGLDGPTALASMLDGKSLYDEEPKNLASFDPAKLKVLHSKLRPRRLQEMLPDHAKAVLERYQTMIERSAHDMSQRETSRVKPYWDPVLRKDDQSLVGLIAGLAQQGLVTFRRAIKERIGLFFVKKKDPAWIRMVIDSRRVNDCHKQPPTTRLSTPRSYLDIQFPPTEGDAPLAFGIEADVNDCFYNYYSEELASWFGIDRPDTVAFWRGSGVSLDSIFDDDAQCFRSVHSDEVVYPVFRGLCMGWAWSLYFANESVNFIVNGLQSSPSREIRDKTPLPDIRDGPLTGVYVDNVSIIGRTQEEVATAADKVAQHFSDCDIPLTWTTEKPVAEFETVGIILDFKSGVIRNKPKRLWKIFFAGRSLLCRRRVSVKLLETWLGHITYAFMITPSALSVFFHIYRFIQKHRDQRAPLWGCVRQEIRNALGVLWLSRCNILFDPIQQVDAGDASMGAYALLTTWSSQEEIRHLCKWRETWRYQPLPAPLREAVATGSRKEVVDALSALESEVSEGHIKPLVRSMPVFGAGLKTQYAEWLIEAERDSTSWLKTSSVKSQLRAKPKKKLEMEVPALVMPIPDSMCQRHRYSLLWRRKWRQKEGHINQKESAVCLSSLRRTARVRSLHGKIKVTLTDNLAALCSLEKGRSSSYHLNRICRQACSYQLGTGIRWRLRHVETLRNPADKDSRFDQLGCKQSLSRKAASQLSQCRVGRKHPPLVSRDFKVAPVQLEGGARDGTAHQSASSTGDNSREFPTGRKGLFLEIFSGTGRLTGAIKECGRACLRPIDAQNGEHHDLRRRASQRALLSFIRAGWVSYVHLGNPCTVFSGARHFISNQVRARERERVGIELGMFSAEVISTCKRFNVHWSLENPRNSRLFELPFLRDELHAPGVHRVDLDFCQYGEPFKKPTSIFTTYEPLKRLAAACDHKKHQSVLRGSEKVEVVSADGIARVITVPRPQRAGAYPCKLAIFWAQIVSPLCVGKNRDTDTIASQCEHELWTCSKAAKNCCKQIPAGSQFGYHLQQFRQEIPTGEAAVVFGQHTAKEAVQRRRRQKKQKQTSREHSA